MPAFRLYTAKKLSLETEQYASYDDQPELTLGVVLEAKHNQDVLACEEANNNGHAQKAYSSSRTSCNMVQRLILKRRRVNYWINNR
jgi:hypothetical protein